MLVQQAFSGGLSFSLQSFFIQDCDESAACSWMAWRDSKFIATTLKPCKNSHIEHKRSMLSLLLAANAEHSIFNKKFIVLCISPWHSTFGIELASCMCTSPNVCHRVWSYNDEKKCQRMSSSANRSSDVTWPHTFWVKMPVPRK